MWLIVFNVSMKLKGRYRLLPGAVEVGSKGLRVRRGLKVIPALQVLKVIPVLQVLKVIRD
jgi:Tfp pilus assembly ATPase PilU